MRYIALMLGLTFTALAQQPSEPPKLFVQHRIDAARTSTEVPAQSPTLKATADWLHNFIESEGVVFHPDGNWIDQYHRSMTGCHVIILQDNTDLSCTKPENKSVCSPGFPHSTTYNFKREFDLKDIDPDRIEVEQVSRTQPGCLLSRSIVSISPPQMNGPWSRVSQKAGA